MGIKSDTEREKAISDFIFIQLERVLGVKSVLAQ